MVHLCRAIVAVLCVAWFSQAQDYIDTQGSSENNPWVYNVPKAISFIPVRTEVFLEAWTQDFIKRPRYTPLMAHRFEAIFGDINRFQSIKRLPEYLDMGNFMLVAGTDPHEPESQLFIVHLPSQEQHGLFKKNLVKNKPKADDTIIKKIALSRTYWFAGSIDTCGSYIAISTYNATDSTILFYKISYKSGHDKNNAPSIDELEIKNLNITIERKSVESHAVAMTRLLDGHFVVAVWTHHNRTKKPCLDFYFSKDTDITHGFDTANKVSLPLTLCYNYHGKHDFQNINFIHDYDGKLYLVGFENSASRDPLHIGQDSMALFELHIRTITSQMKKEALKFHPDSITAALDVGAKRPYITYLFDKQMFCKQDKCNFSSGATVYIPDQQRILLYSMPQWLIDGGKLLVFAQFASIQKTYPS